MANNTLEMEKYEDKLKYQDSQVYESLEAIKTKVANLRQNLREPVINFLLAENAKLKNEIEANKKQLINGEVEVILEPAKTPQNISEVSPKVDSIKVSSVGNAVKNEGNPKKDKKKEPVTNVTIDVGLLDFRVGKIISVEKHPNADTLYIEQIDVGETTPRTVVSGLVNYYKMEELQDQMVVLLCNLKPATMRGVKSQAMVMCASSQNKVEFLQPPESSCPGDLIEVEGYERRPSSVLNPKKKIFETCAPDLKTDSKGLPTYKGNPFIIKGQGYLKAIDLYDVQIK